MRLIFILPILLFLASCGYEYDGWYDQCREKAAITASTNDGLKILLRACNDKDIPKTCRDISDADEARYEKEIMRERIEAQRKSNENKTATNGVPLGAPGGLYFEPLGSTPLSRCIAECDSANFISKRFGKCSKG